WRRYDPQSSRVHATAALRRRPIGHGIKAYLRQGTQWSAASPTAARAPRAATPLPRRQAAIRTCVALLPPRACRITPDRLSIQAIRTGKNVGQNGEAVRQMCTAEPEPSMSQMGQTRSFGHVGSMSGLPENGHGWAIHAYTPSA